MRKFSFFVITLTFSLILSGCSAPGLSSLKSSVTACGVSVKDLSRVAVPKTAAHDLGSSDAAFTADESLIVDISSSWDAVGLKAIGQNCVFKALGLSPETISAVALDAKSQLKVFSAVKKGSSYYKGLVATKTKELAAAKNAHAWNQRLAAYTAQVKNNFCSVYQCDEYWRYSIAGDERCKVAEFCTLDSEGGTWLKLPIREGKAVTQKAETALASAKDLLAATTAYENNDPVLFHPLGEGNLSLAWAFSTDKGLLAVLKHAK